MYPDKTVFEETLALISKSGIQFADFPVILDIKKSAPGEFIQSNDEGPLIRLQYDERKGNYYSPFDPATSVKPAYSVDIKDSLALLKDQWLPLPFFRKIPPRSFDNGPINWARIRFVELEPGTEVEGYTHRFTIAFDTACQPANQSVAYLAPTNEDISSGNSFGLASNSRDLGWFLDLPWVNSWLQEVFEEQVVKKPFSMDQEDIVLELRAQRHQAHYLNLLKAIASWIEIPDVKLIANNPKSSNPPIPVDMTLDVGNSRTCGVLIEDHPQQASGLSRRYELQLRDLSFPERVYNKPFESRIEFSQPILGKDHISAQSGRGDAFLWPTLVRVGPEATQLASNRRGTEGSTGISSPKRYLWDEDSYNPGWRFNCAYVKSDTEPHATSWPMGGLINDKGTALYQLPASERMPVFVPHYSRSSLMTFMMTEILAQALMQINSPAQRMRMEHAQTPRYLRSLILTIPPSMPKPEREIFTQCVESAIVLVWKALGWHPVDDEIDMEDEEQRKSVWPYLPSVHIRWDEATCAQMVYLFNEVNNHFAGDVKSFFRIMARPGRKDLEKNTKSSHEDVTPTESSASDAGIADDQDIRTLTVASLDIGGGTTDLVITEFCLDAGRGSNVSISPNQCFRDGFKIAGDDILKDTIQRFLLPVVKKAIIDKGIKDPDPVLSYICGNEKLQASEEVLRQQLTLQIFVPLGLLLLKHYENYDPVEADKSDPTKFHVSGTFAELLAKAKSAPSDNVIEFFNKRIDRETGVAGSFDILDIHLDIPLRQIHEAFINDRYEISKSLTALCQIMEFYPCDVLLLTGRPSCLPGIISLFQKLLPLPPGRIRPLYHYHTGGWYPFNRMDEIEDPKTTAAVGAMICLLSEKGRLPGFYFQSQKFTPYSTIKYLGLINEEGFVDAADVYYQDINLDDEDYELPEQSFELRGLTRLGYRQLSYDRWPAMPLYNLQPIGSNNLLKVSLKTLKATRKGGGAEKFEILRVTNEAGNSVSRDKVELRLNTMLGGGLQGLQRYWLDSGSIFLS